MLVLYPIICCLPEASGSRYFTSSILSPSMSSATIAGRYSGFSARNTTLRKVMSSAWRKYAPQAGSSFHWENSG